MLGGEDEIVIEFIDGADGRGYIKGWSTINNRKGSEPYKQGNSKSISYALRELLAFLSEGKVVHITVDESDS